MSYPLLRSQLNNVNATWSYDDKTLENYAADALNSNYKIKASNLGINSNYIDFSGPLPPTYSARSARLLICLGLLVPAAAGPMTIAIALRSCGLGAGALLRRFVLTLASAIVEAPT